MQVTRPSLSCVFSITQVDTETHDHPLPKPDWLSVYSLFKYSIQCFHDSCFTHDAWHTGYLFILFSNIPSRYDSSFTRDAWHTGCLFIPFSNIPSNVVMTHPSHMMLDKQAICFFSFQLFHPVLSWLVLHTWWLTKILEFHSMTSLTPFLWIQIVSAPRHSSASFPWFWWTHSYSYSYYELTISWLHTFWVSWTSFRAWRLSFFRVLITSSLLDSLSFHPSLFCFFLFLDLWNISTQNLTGFSRLSIYCIILL